MIKNFIKKLLGRDLLFKNLQQNKELEWAHIYHDSIRGRAWLTKLPINVGRWAGNYAFFYVLNRILNDCKPKEILEFGFGESSKVISAYLDNYLTESTHTIIENDMDWKANFKERFTLSSRSSIQMLPLEKKRVKGFETNGYSGIQKFINKKYDFYLVDGPLGNPNYSRYDIVNIAKDFDKNDEFIIMMDDYNRAGEQQTFEALKHVLKEKDIEIYTGFYAGLKEVAVIGTHKYRFVGGF